MKLRRNARAAGALPGPINWGSLQHSHIRSSSIKGLLLDGREGRGEKVEGRERVGKKKGRKREKERGIGTPPLFVRKFRPWLRGSTTHGDASSYFSSRYMQLVVGLLELTPGPGYFVSMTVHTGYD